MPRATILILTLILQGAFCTCRDMTAGLPQAPAQDAAVYVDRDDVDFEEPNALSDFTLTGIPDGPVGDAAFKAATVRAPDGGSSTALSFSYIGNRAGAPALFHTVLMTDFTRLTFMIKSERATTWVVAMEDRDRAVFAAFIDCPENTWQNVELTAKDFHLTDDSPVRKNKLDPARLSYGYAAFDVNALTTPGIENTVLLDDIFVTRLSYRLIDGDFILNGRTAHISEPTYIRGNLYLVNGARLSVRDTRFVVAGEIGLDTGRFLAKNTFLHIKQEYRGQHMLIVKNGVFEAHNVDILSEYDICGAALEGSRFSLSDVNMVMSGFSFSALSGSALSLLRTANGGEFISFEDSTLRFQDSSGFIFWICSGQELEKPLLFPNGDKVTEWRSPPELTNRVTLHSCAQVLYGFIAQPGCRITFRESRIRALGFLFNADSVDTVSNLSNNASFSDTTIRTTLHSLRFLDTTVGSWNFYAEDRARLTLKSCVYGESISMGEAAIRIVSSHCDGTGGFLGTEGNSRMIVTGSEITCMVLAQDNSRLEFDRSTIQGDVIAADTSVITLHHTRHDGKSITNGRGRIQE
ncbi:MAG TPA: hypothetical protein ENN69_07380 [Spirochaetia bacterium]|nr:hypothetical protein [Spirochaetia bacterium]